MALRSVRLRIGNYFYKAGNFDQAVNWYAKIVRKEKLEIEQSPSARFEYEEDLSKLQSSLIQVMEGTFLKLSQILGLGVNGNLKSLLTDPNFFLNDINDLVKATPQKDLKNLKEELSNFDTISNFSNLWQNSNVNRQFDDLVAIGFFFKGIIQDAEGNFVSADSNYEKAISLSSRLLGPISARKKKVADQYFRLSPSIRKVSSWNVFLESQPPLVITGVIPGGDNYLEYESCPINVIITKYSGTRLKIQGRVLGKQALNYITPRVVFLGAKGYIGEAKIKYPVTGDFNINFVFTVPDGTQNVIPRITFDGCCFTEGQKIILKDVKWH
jgi:hypothetical protein